MNAVGRDANSDWRNVSLGDIADTQLGKTINPRTKLGPRQRPYLRNANVQWDRIDLNDVATMDFSEAEAAVYDLKPGDLLVCEGGIVGRGAIWQGEMGECHFQNALHRVRPRNGDVSAEWLLENLRWLSATGRLAEAAQGVTIQHLSQKQLRSLQIILPPRPIQDSRLLELTEARKLSENAAMHLGQARRAMIKFRQSVFAAACSGRLTAGWRRAHQPQSRPGIYNDRSAPGATHKMKLRRGVDPNAPTDDLLRALPLPETWRVLTTSRLLAEGILLDVKDGNHGSMHPTAKDFSQDGMPFITANCVNDGAIDYEHAPRVSGAALARLRVGFAEPNDVVLTHKGSVGRVAINTRECILTPQTTYYRSDNSILLPEYLALYFQSAYFARQLDSVKSQTTRDFVPISEQYLLSVILPPVNEQREIVQQATQQLTASRLFMQRIANAEKSLGRIANSLLARAFRDEPMKFRATP